MDIDFFTLIQKRMILEDTELQIELNLSDDEIKEIRDSISRAGTLPHIGNFVALSNAQIVLNAISELDEAMSLFCEGDSIYDLQKSLEVAECDLYISIGNFQKQMLCKK